MESRIAGRGYLAAIVAESKAGSLRLLCPFCDGGPDREISLVLTIRDDGAFYCCHRASCGAKGTIGANIKRLLGGPGSKVQAQQHEPYRGDFAQIQHDDPAGRRFYARPWGDRVLVPSTIGLYTDATRSKEVWVLRNLMGERVGVQVRWTEGGKKRVKTYKETEGDVYTAYGCLEGGELLPTWIVEDPMSAAMIYSWGRPAVALCGTYITPRLAVELMSQEAYTSGFYVALDPGAEMAARRVYQTLASVAALPIQTRYLVCDVKDMNLTQLQDILQR